MNVKNIKIKNLKCVMCITLLLFIICINNVMAINVDDNDGSAFISKSEFDSLKNDFQSQIDKFNSGIDSTIDTAIAAYLSGITIVQHVEPPLITNAVKQIQWIDGFYVKKVTETFVIPSGHTLIGKNISSNLSSARSNPGSTTATTYYWDESQMYDPVEYGAVSGNQYIKWTDMDDSTEVVGATWIFTIPSVNSRTMDKYFQPMQCVLQNTTLGTNSLKYLYPSGYLQRLNTSSYGSNTHVFKPASYCVADGYNHGYPGSFGQNSSMLPDQASQAFRVNLYRGTQKSTAAPSTWQSGYDIASTYNENFYWAVQSSFTQYHSATAWENYFRQGTNEYITQSAEWTSDTSKYMFGAANSQRAYTLKNQNGQFYGRDSSAFNGCWGTRDLTFSSMSGYWYDPRGATAYSSFRATTWPWAYNWANKCPSGTNSPRLNIPNHWGLTYMRDYNSDLLSGTEQQPKLYQGCPLFEATVNGVYRIKVTTTNNGTSASPCTNKISFKIGAFENTTGNGNTLKLCDVDGNELSTYASNLTANDGTNKFDYYIKCRKGDIVWVKLSPTNVQNKYAQITDVKITGDYVM